MNTNTNFVLDDAEIFLAYIDAATVGFSESDRKAVRLFASKHAKSFTPVTLTEATTLIHHWIEMGHKIFPRRMEIVAE